jgi:hypothetical protein
MGAQKKLIPAIETSKMSLNNDSSQNVVQKAEIERMKKLISEKIKDPKLAKKAALVIAEMLKSKD